MLAEPRFGDSSVIQIGRWLRQEPHKDIRYAQLFRRSTAKNRHRQNSTGTTLRFLALSAESLQWEISLQFPVVQLVFRC